VKQETILNLDDLSLRLVYEACADKKRSEIEDDLWLHCCIDQWWKNLELWVFVAKAFPKGALVHWIPSIDPLKVESDRSLAHRCISKDHRGVSVNN
jgi:hypothetical protein